MTVSPNFRPLCDPLGHCQAENAITGRYSGLHGRRYQQTNSTLSLTGLLHHRERDLLLVGLMVAASVRFLPMEMDEESDKLERWIV